MYDNNKFAEMANLLKKNAPQDGIQRTNIENLIIYRASAPDKRKPTVYEPFIVIAGQGQKRCYVGTIQYDYSAGNYLTLFLPMPIETEILKATSEEPFIAAYILIDLNRLADILIKIDRIEGIGPDPKSSELSGIFSAPLNDNMLDPTIRLLKSLDNPTEANILGESIMDEFYYRLLCDEQGGNLKYLLRQRGHIQRISKAVEYIHQNLEESVSVDKLAELVNMSISGFHKSFKDVMHLSPLQYAKSIKLYKAQTLLKEGKNVSQVGYMVGYNSLPQFSREYKRHFGFAPSAT